MPKPDMSTFPCYDEEKNVGRMIEADGTREIAESFGLRREPA
jgi:hypothetical protein